MVLLIIIPKKNGYFIGKIKPIFRQTHFLVEEVIHQSLADVYVKQDVMLVDVITSSNNHPIPCPY